jgi:hypothetical protein
LTTPEEAADEEQPDNTFGAVPDKPRIADDPDAGQAEFGSAPNDTPAQVEQSDSLVSHEIPKDLSVPHWLRRSTPEAPSPRQDGKWAGTFVSDDDDVFIENGKFK